MAALADPFTSLSQQAVPHRRGPIGALATGLTFFEHHRYPMAGEPLFADHQSLVFIGSENRCYSDALGKVRDDVEQQAHDLGG